MQPNTPKGVRRLEETALRLGGEGDNWHMSWAKDGSQVVGLCDGSAWPDVPGYEGKAYNTRIFRILGDPPNLRFVHLPEYPDLLTEAAPNLHRYYGFGILALDNKIYHFLSTPNYPFLSGPNPRFIGIKLIYSPDNGETWLNQDGSSVTWEKWEMRDRTNMLFFNEPDQAFSLLTVLQMGRNYAHNKDGYVYIYAPNGNVEGKMNELVLCRVPKRKILNRAVYEFFEGYTRGNGAIWTRDIGGRAAVHSFPSGWVNTQIHPYAWHPSVVYNPSLDLYMMVNWGMGCSPDGMWFGKPSYLGFWISKTPWGPWDQIHEDAHWTPVQDGGARAYQPQISPKWISPDGRSFWLVWTDFQELGGRRPYYAFNLQKVELLF